MTMNKILPPRGGIDYMCQEKRWKIIRQRWDFCKYNNSKTLGIHKNKRRKLIKVEYLKDKQ